jgi:hypothetical protein
MNEAESRADRPPFDGFQGRHRATIARMNAQPEPPMRFGFELSPATPE